MSRQETVSRTNRLQRLLRESLGWIAVSGFSFVLVFSLTFIGHEYCGLSADTAFALAITIATGINFVNCRYLVFRATSENAVAQMRLFVISVVGLRLGEYLAFSLLLYLLAGIPYQYLLLFIQAVACIVKFFVMKVWVFSK